MVGNGTEVIGQVAQEIDALKPGQVVDELTPFIEGGYLESMVAAEGVSRTLAVMEAVGEAIGRAPNHEDRTALAVHAVGGLAEMLLDDDFTPDHFEDSAEALVEQAAMYARLIENPQDRSVAMSKLAEGTMAFVLSYDDTDEVLRAATKASSFVEEAVEAAENMEDGSVQAGAFAKAAEARTEIDFQLLRSGNPVDDDKAVRIYEQAIGATDAIEDAEDRYHHRDNIVRSAVRSAAKVHQVSGNSELYESLLDLSLAKIDEELAGYETGGEEAGLSPWEKAINCIRLGGKISAVIDKEFSIQQSDNARQALIGRMVSVYRAALEYRREANATFEEYDHNDRINFTDSPLEAAEKLLPSEFDTAKELMAMGFDLSLAHKDPEHVSEYSKRAIDKIRGYAEQQTSVRRAFEVFSMLYQAQRATQAPESGLPSDDDELTYTVFRNLWYLADAPPEDVALEEIDRDFIEFTVRHAVADAAEPVYPRNNIEHIHKLSEYVADPELKRAIVGQYESLRAKDEAARRPTARIARIAFDHWQPDKN